MLLHIKGTAQYGVKSWWQECEVVGQVSSAVRQRREENAGTRLSFHIYLVQNSRP